MYGGIVDFPVRIQLLSPIKYKVNLSDDEKTQLEVLLCLAECGCKRTHSHVSGKLKQEIKSGEIPLFC